jgi:hypothetical protein
VFAPDLTALPVSISRAQKTTGRASSVPLNPFLPACAGNLLAGNDADWFVSVGRVISQD